MQWRLQITLPTLVLGTLLFTVAACVPIPVPRTAMIQPEGTVRVVSAASEAPLHEASVTVARYHIAPPPSEEGKRPLHLWTLLTDEAGEAHFTHESEREWVMPLMMHGVPFRVWVVCASAEGHAAGMTRWYVEGNEEAAKRIQSGEEPLPTIVIDLQPGLGDTCEALLHRAEGATSKK